MTNDATILPITVADTAKGTSHHHSAVRLDDTHGSVGKTRQTIKFWSMVVLVVQNSALVLMMRYTMTKAVDRYSTTSCVFFMEITKILICLGIIFYQKGFSTRAFISTIYSTILGSPIDTLKMLIPATIYAIQNNLLFVAIENLDAAVYQVTYQLKILTTAMFSVLMMQKQLRRMQWFALLLLMTGVAMVQLELQARKGTDTNTTQSPTKGLVAVLLACFSSGFAGVYFEKVVKSAESNIWVRNIQLGIFGSIFSCMAMLTQDGEMIVNKGIFFGYTWLVVGVVLMQALGGLVVAMVVKYADNILKGFATSLSIVLSAVITAYLISSLPSLQFIAGTGVVMLSVYLYSLP